MSVTMFYRVQVADFNSDISKCGYGFGTIISRHKDDFTAHKEAEKVNSKASVAGAQQAVFEFTTDERLEVGSVHAEIVWEANVQRLRDIQVYHCSKIIEKMKTGVPAEKACHLLDLRDEFGQHIAFDDWMIRFSADANKRIEADIKRSQEIAADAARRNSVVKSFEKAADAMTYSFPAVKGIQAGKEFYIAQVPFKYLVRFFTFADENVPAELRAQRKVNPSHAKEIGEYVVNNRFDYVLPSLTASVSAAMVFDPLCVDGLADRLGVLRIPLDATILTNDGPSSKSSRIFLKC